MQINIDDSAGFCWGVVQTIDKVESTLKECKNKKVHVIGQIIHNPKESERLAFCGLKTITQDELDLINPDDSVVIVRAHGEPPTTFNRANELGIELIDATCPLVRSLQSSVRKYFNDGWQILIFGKYDHAEVIGIRGVCNDECIVIRDIEIVINRIDFNKKTVLFSQTTMDKPTFCKLADDIRNQFEHYHQTKIDGDFFLTKNTICKFVSKRESKLIEFAKSHDLVIFVAGKNSSNGKILYQICKNANENTKFIEDTDEIDYSNIAQYNRIGITGATSTPQWFMEHIKVQISQMFNN